MVRALLAGAAVAIGLAASGPVQAHGVFFAAPAGPVVVVPQQRVFTFPARPVIVVPQQPVFIFPQQPVIVVPPTVFVDPFCCAVVQPRFGGVTGLGSPGRSGWVR